MTIPIAPLSAVSSVLPAVVGQRMSSHRIDLLEYGIFAKGVLRNPSRGLLYEDAIRFDEGLTASSGAIVAYSRAKTGRSPKDKRIVDEPKSSDDVWWGNVNIKLPPTSFLINRKRAVDYLTRCPRMYVIDGYAGWDLNHRIKVRVICSRPYHALFMRNMLIRPTEEELASFGQPDWVIFNAGPFPADDAVPGVSSETSVCISFQSQEMVILGTEYAGEMKKGVFTIMHYLMPKRGVLSMHCSANEGAAGDVTLFFGLSGTGKTTLSADPRRKLIGDDEHCWTDGGIFNIEGGCYAKCINLSKQNEPEIFGAIRFGTVLENVVVDPETRMVDFSDATLTENTRASYPIRYMPNVKIPCLGGHPKNIILLTCDAFGVLPPVSKLTPQQLMYHFISGYTAKVAGTEVGVKEPEATFSACFGAAFLVWHPMKYAELLAAKMQQHAASAWLINTGWTGGPYGTGSRIKLAHTRAIVDAVHDGSLAKSATVIEPRFGLSVPISCPNVPSEVLLPRQTWQDAAAYDAAAQKLAGLFRENFSHFADQSTAEVRQAAPK
ncbi:MAG TPA: phosphoenolpyruvate carboxykinase (ATP) [Pirellulaceae bacterium]|nr:phosphoenolpyruvate carboxykinase (ATP) [Pirellulaceae bacterium]